jgi:hypothetical protein
MHHSEKQIWVQVTKGSLEECLDDLFEWRLHSASYPKYDSVRLEVTRPA